MNDQFLDGHKSAQNVEIIALYCFQIFILSLESPCLHVDFFHLKKF